MVEIVPFIWNTQVGPWDRACVGWLGVLVVIAFP
jgi:hypothetical protein